MLVIRNRWSRLVATIAGLVLLGCAGGSQQPQAVSLAELVADQDAYDDSMVITQGTVQTYDQPRHYWIEDTEQHRVELFPHELVEELVGQRIRVTGRFTFVDDRGRGIDVDELEVMDAPLTALPSPEVVGGAPPDPASGDGDRVVDRYSGGV